MQGRLKFWGWGLETEVLHPEEVSALEGALRRAEEVQMDCMKKSADQVDTHLSRSDQLQVFLFS